MLARSFQLDRRPISRIDGSELPDYEVVRGFLGPAGLMATSLDDGWLCVGFTIAKQPTAVTGNGSTGDEKAEVIGSTELQIHRAALSTE